MQSYYLISRQAFCHWHHFRETKIIAHNSLSPPNATHELTLNVYRLIDFHRQTNTICTEKRNNFLMYFIQHYQLGTCSDESTVRATLNQYSLVWQKTGWLPKPKAFHGRAFIVSLRDSLYCVGEWFAYIQQCYILDVFSPLHIRPNSTTKVTFDCLIGCVNGFEVEQMNLSVYSWKHEYISNSCSFLWPEYCNLKNFNE